MRLKFAIQKKGATALLLMLSFLVYSCQKEEGLQTSDDSWNVKINQVTVDFGAGDLGSKKGMKAAKLASAGEEGSEKFDEEAVQEFVVPFNDQLSILATLTPETGTSSLNKEMSTNGRKVAASTAVQNQLAPGVMYRVLVYDSVGNLKGFNDYRSGNEANANGFKLDGGSEYTFVAYSFNQTFPLPFPNNQLNLSLASIDQVSADLMYFKKKIRLKDGVNLLDIVLKHQFSQITTNINLAESTQGLITSINTATIKPTRAFASLRLNDGVITYSPVNGNGAAVSFPGIGTGVRSISSTPTLLISPATANGTFNIGSITIGGTTKGNIAFNNLNINPGRRYNLNLLFQSPCFEDVSVDGAFNFNQNGGTAPEKTILAPAADFGFVFDVTSLDNSFNLTINGTPLITNAAGTNHEIQFQLEDVPAEHPRNIRFADGTIWGAGGIPQIYSMTGTSTNPVIRVVISATGDVFMYGSKTSGGELFPLVLTGGHVFNNINWSSTAQNEVKVSQVVTGQTTMVGNGTGRRIIACP